MTREVRIAIGVVAALGVLVFLLLVVGSLGGVRPELDPLTVEEVLAGAQPPAERYGRAELRIVGYYAELDAGCRGDEGGADATVAWLQSDCPLRVLLNDQPTADVSQAELEREGLRLTAPIGRPFPSRAQPTGPNLQLQALVFAGHFDDPAAASCVAEHTERCRNTFVVSDYEGFVR